MSDWEIILYCIRRRAHLLHPYKKAKEAFFLLEQNREYATPATTCSFCRTKKRLKASFQGYSRVGFSGFYFFELVVNITICNSYFDLSLRTLLQGIHTCRRQRWSTLIFFTNLLHDMGTIKIDDYIWFNSVSIQRGLTRLFDKPINICCALCTIGIWHWRS
jgi:hypothetical protein